MNISNEYYEPIDCSTFDECDMCSCVRNYDDLTHVKNNSDDMWLCYDCADAYWLRVNMELEEQEKIEQSLLITNFVQLQPLVLLFRMTILEQLVIQTQWLLHGLLTH